MKKHGKNWRNANYLIGRLIHQACSKLLLLLLCGTIAAGNAIGQCSCPSGPNNFNIGSDGATTTLGQSGLPAGSVTGACISIKGKLKISSSYTFDACTITMGTGAEIEMLPNGQPLLTIKNNTVIAGCTTMWKGISLGTGTRIDMEGCTIKDAQYAIKLVNTCFYRLVNNFFDANYVGVFVPAPISGANQINGLTNNGNPFSGNSFQITGTYRGPYAGQTPAPGFAPYAGILFNSVVQTTIGNPTNGSIVNHFTNLRNGIVDNLGNSNVYSGLNVSNLTSASNIEGAGVYIFKNAGPITVRNTTMTGVRYGVYGDKPKALNVLNNVISTISHGIYLSNPTKGAVIQGNTVNNSLTNTSNATCITILQSSNGANSPHSILNNVLAPRKDAIYLQNIIGKLVVSGNDITLPSTNNGPFGIFGVTLSGPTTISGNTITKIAGTIIGASGISLTQSTNAQVTDNHINTAQSASNNSALAVGVRIADSPNSLYCCNQVNFSGIGFSFSGICNDTKLANTSFGEHMVGTQRYGLLLSAGQISQQNNNGNDWTNAVDLKHARYQGSIGLIWNSVFFTDQSLVPGGLSKIQVPPGANPSDWFKFQGTDPTCASQVNCGVPFLPLTGEGGGNDINGGELTVADLSALMPPSSGYIVDEVLNWKNQRYLYQKLLDHPNLVNWSLVVNNFFNNAQNGLVGKFQSVNKGIRELGFPPTSLTASYEQVLQNISTEADPGELEQLVQDLEQLEQQIAAWKANRIAELMAELNSFPTITAYQQDEKDVLLLYLQTLAQDITSFTPEQESFIELLANKCALEAGTGVYWARMLRQYYNPGWDWQDDCLPLAYRSMEQGNQTISPTSTVSLYPNPADGKVSISLGEPMEEAGLVTVYDFQGKELLTAQVLPGTSEMNLDTSKLPNGFYAVKIAVHNRLINTYKLVIEH